MATAEYVVKKANHKADSGTSHMIKIIKPILFQTWATVIAHAGPQSRSDEKQMKST